MGNGPYYSSGESSSDALMTKLRTLHGNAAPEPDQGERKPDSGAGGCVSLEGRGTMEKQ